MFFTPRRDVRKPLHALGVQTNWSMLSGGLRYATTTGYYLSAFQAEIRRKDRSLHEKLS
jgi:hypothetical protein